MIHSARNFKAITLRGCRGAQAIVENINTPRRSHSNWAPSARWPENPREKEEIVLTPPPPPPTPHTMQHSTYWLLHLWDPRHFFLRLGKGIRKIINAKAGQFIGQSIKKSSTCSASFGQFENFLCPFVSKVISNCWRKTTEDNKSLVYIVEKLSRRHKTVSK